MRAGAPDKVVFEACGSCLPALASNPVLRRALRRDRAAAPLRARVGGGARGAAAGARGARLAGAGRDRTNPARARGRGPLRRLLGGGRAGGRAQAMKNVRVLHLAKVAGISGSEAHLLSLLPSLVERGWDVRFLMLHEHEPGAWDFARELESRGVTLDAIPLGADVDPAAFLRLCAYLARHGRRSCTRTSSTATSTASSPARHARPGSREHEARLQRVPRGARLRARRSLDRRALAHLHVAISRGLARYLKETEGFAEETFEIVHYGIRPQPDARPYDGDVPRLLCVGRLIPIKGHLVLLRAFRDARAELPELELEIAGRGPLEPALRALRARARHRRRGALSRPGESDPDGDRADGDQRRPLARRGLRDGRARGDGARPARDRGRDRRPRRARRGRPHGIARRTGRSRAARAGDRRACLEPGARAARWARPAGSGPSTASSRIAAPTGPSCSTAPRSRPSTPPQRRRRGLAPTQAVSVGGTSGV